MAETATIARPYAEALFKAVHADYVNDVAAQVDALAAVAADPQMRQFAENPKVDARTVHELITSVAKRPLSNAAKNLLSTVIDNGRLAALPEIATQFRSLANARSGVSEATVYSAFPMDDAQLAEVASALEKRFGCKLNAKVEVDPELIGGVRVVVGDEVLDASVKARLERMKMALTA
jgi:F-type H+-transporting ATPase subunit delta